MSGYNNILNHSFIQQKAQGDKYVVTQIKPPYLIMIIAGEGRRSEPSMFLEDTVDYQSFEVRVFNTLTEGFATVKPKWLSHRETLDEFSVWGYVTGEEVFKLIKELEH